jgi:hypothetical protein
MQPLQRKRVKGFGRRENAGRGEVMSFLPIWVLRAGVGLGAGGLPCPRGSHNGELITQRTQVFFF